MPVGSEWISTLAGVSGAAQVSENRQHRVNRIYVIEAIPPGDLRTGTDLYEITLAQRTPHNRDFSAARYEPKSRAEFLAVLGEIERHTGEDKVMPMLHIDAHGDIDGLEVGDDFLTWEEMKEGITAINVACRNHLVVVLAACMGLHLIRIIRAQERAPAFAIISTAAVVPAGDIGVSFRAMYEEIFRSRDGDKALQRLNRAYPSEVARYGIIHSERMFLDAFQHYVTAGLSPEKVMERAERLERESRRSPILSQREMLNRREGMTRYLVDGLKERFEADRDRFFMVDLDPANRGRFPVSFDQIKLPEGLLCKKG